MGKSFTNIWWFVIMITLLVIFISSVNILASIYVNKPGLDLSSENSIYAQNILNINLSEYTATDLQVQQSTAYNQKNDTGDTNKDTALEFFYSRSIFGDIELVAKGIYSFPTYVATLLNINKNSINWILFILNFFWRLAIVVSVYYAVRGIVT